MSSNVRRARLIELIAIGLLLGTTVPPLRAQYIQQGDKLTPAVTGQSWFSDGIALSADGNTAVISAPLTNGGVGEAWVYTRSLGVWSQRPATLAPSGVAFTPNFGQSVAISSDGNTVAVGGPKDNHGAGAVWIFVRVNEVWAQQGPKLLPGPQDGELGWSVALSGDGNTLLAGAPSSSGYLGPCSAWMFTRSNGVWAQQARLSDSTATGAFMGISVALSGDGNTAMVGGFQDSALVGAAWIYTRINGTWTQQGPKLVGSGASGKAWQASSVALSADGNTALLGGPYDANSAGATWVFTRQNGTWSQQGNKLVGTGSAGMQYQGMALALSGDGNSAIIGGYVADKYAGALWSFSRSNGTWTQQGNKFLGVGSAGTAYQGRSIAISSDGNTLMEGGFEDNSEVGAVWAFVKPTPTTTTIVSSDLTGSAGSPITLSATVTSSNLNLSGLPAGSVAFSDANALIPGGIVALNASSQAQFTTALAPGAHALAATFVPSNPSQAASVGNLTLTVNRAASVTMLSASGLPAPALTATVSGSLASAAPSGSVQFVDTATGTVLGTAALGAGGTATFPVSPDHAPLLATHPLVAMYSGDATFGPSTSAAAGIPVLVNAAGGASATFAAGEFVTLFGYGIATGTAQGTPPLPVTLGGAAIRVTDAAGAVAPGALSYASATQINFVMPDGLANGPARIELLHGNVAVSALPVTIGRVAPGIFTANGAGSGPAAAQILSTAADGTQTVQDASEGVRFGAAPVYLVLYGTGIRSRGDLQSVSCTIGGQILPAIYAGPQGTFPGLDQVDVLLPSTLAGAGTVDIVLTVDGTVSNTAKLLFP